MIRVALFGLVGALFGGGLGVMIAAAPDEGEVFITSDQPITPSQVQEKLRSDGWQDVQITEQGRYLEIAASKVGQSRRMMVDTLTGRLIADDDD